MMTRARFLKNSVPRWRWRCCLFLPRGPPLLYEYQHRRYSVEAATATLVEPGVKEYEEYRRSLYGEITHKALLVDAVGTLLVPSQPMAQIYRKIGEKYGVKYSENEILDRYRWAYEQPWGRSRIREKQSRASFCATLKTLERTCPFLPSQAHQMHE
ncbi:hypothetical protein J5N97_012983 [Dioscorea zingiberensis]|uniref:Uncharacterized protein n=1 Tax=Dioscorea zingiberensis TaxID=325984 RepID=A0A9D5HIB1_9LILI|nr:hypothetical protein J5N97_012983 [Dioscorea zingiberensis]